MPDFPRTLPVALTDVQIDVDKDWGGHDIIGVRYLDVSQEARRHTAGENLVVYKCVYLDGILIKAADPLASPAMPVAGLTLTSGGSGASLWVLREGIVSNASWSLTSGSPLFLMSGGIIGNTPPSASGNVVQELGKSLTQNSIEFDPEQETLIIGE